MNEYDFPQEHLFHPIVAPAQLAARTVEWTEDQNPPKCGWEWFETCKEHDSCQAWQSVRNALGRLLVFTSQNRGTPKEPSKESEA